MTEERAKLVGRTFQHFKGNLYRLEGFAKDSETLESLESERVVDLANPPAVIPPDEIVFKTPTGKYVCSVCGYVYDLAENDGVAFEDLPADWRCPRCRQPKDKFNRA